MSGHDFPVESSETLHVGPVFAVRRDQVRMPGGRVAARDIVENPGAVAVVAIEDDDTVVLIDQYRHAVGRRLRELPAGLLDSPGEDPRAAAARELVEEVGVTAREWSVLVDVVPSPGFSDEAVRVFLARDLTTVTRPDSADDEEADLRIVRVALRDAVDEVLAGTIVNVTTVAGLLAAARVRERGVAVRAADAPWPDRPHRFRQRRP